VSDTESSCRLMVKMSRISFALCRRSGAYELGDPGVHGPFNVRYL